ncbi:hypothetical protein [Streptomyces sp. 769]|uniref:hypothetical protein n=1 Tax=Streptomyces sp. 769 TaxID=1262452 RepID=UPI000581BF8F|nr:hypothetical protein [Streptomyces sp. 769]AJC53989.1 hypothetical protein GZL_01389 [Streptomyces sp. 769]
MSEQVAQPDAPATGEQTPPAAVETPGEETAKRTDWKAHARTWEERARSNKAELDGLQAEVEKMRQERMSDAEKALEAAKADARAAALSEVGTKLASAELRAAAAKASVELTEEITSALDLSKFLAEGEPNADAIQSFVQALASKQPAQPKFAQNIGIGVTGEAPSKAYDPKSIAERVNQMMQY